MEQISEMNLTKISAGVDPNEVVIPTQDINHIYHEHVNHIDDSIHSMFDTLIDVIHQIQQSVAHIASPVKPAG